MNIETRNLLACCTNLIGVIESCQWSRLGSKTSSLKDAVKFFRETHPLEPDNGDIRWRIGASEFNREEVTELLRTQRAMIENDLKRFAGKDLTEEIISVLNKPRTPHY